MVRRVCWDGAGVVAGHTAVELTCGGRYSDHHHHHHHRRRRRRRHHSMLRRDSTLVAGRTKLLPRVRMRGCGEGWEGIIMMCAGGSELCASSREGNARLAVRSELLAHAPTNERLGGGVVLLVALLAARGAFGTRPVPCSSSTSALSTRRWGGILIASVPFYERRTPRGTPSHLESLAAANVACVTP